MAKVVTFESKKPGNRDKGSRVRGELRVIEGVEGQQLPPRNQAQTTFSAFLLIYLGLTFPWLDCHL